MKFTEWIRKKIRKTEDYKYSYHDLAPVDDISDESEYFRALDWSLYNAKISNVALSAPYGAGKSSVIESYLKARKISALQLSLANFNELGEELEPDEVEKEFLKKLFYKVEYKRIPQSRYRKLHKIHLGRIYGSLLVLVAMCLGFLTAFDLSGVKDVIKRLDETRTQLGLSVPVGIGAILGLMCGTLFILSIVLKWTMSKWKNWEISIFDKAKVKNSDDAEESIFNRYLDEIVYFFEETDYEVVFIEDLDRFTATGIFTKLRELNLLLNRYDSIKRHITFVYAIRDDYFPTDTDRTKFFDFIIPIIPYINATNSDDLLRRRISEVNASDIKAEIGDEYITKVSPYIGDMRVLTSIVNEFITYKRTVKKDEALSLNDEELMSLMIFKNLYPKDFADIESERGVIKEAFRCKEAFISKRAEELDGEIEEAERALSIHEKDILKDVQEIKGALFQAIIPNNRVVHVTISNNGNRFSYDQIMADDFDLEQLSNTKLIVQYNLPNYGTASKEVSNVEREYTKNGLSYIERWKAANACQGERIEQLRKNIENKKNEVYKIKATRIQHLIADYGSKTLFEGADEVLENQLLIFMLRNGYIDETYVNYINYYHPDSITPDEHEFILNLRNYGGTKEFTQELPHPDRVIERLVPHEFRQVEVLNFAIVRYLISEKSNSSKTEELFKLLSERTKETIEFIQRYIWTEASTNSAFIKTLAEYNPFLWTDIVEDEVIPDDTKMHYFDLLLANASVDAIEKMEQQNNNVSAFLCGRKGILSEFVECSEEKLIDIIKTLGVKFSETSLDNANEKVTRFIYDNDAYEINLFMIDEIIKYRLPDLYDKAARQNYTVIRTCEDGFCEYIQQNIETYIERIVVAGDNREESQDAIEELFALIGYDVELAKKIIQAQNTIFVSIDNLAAVVDEDNKEAVQEIIDYLIEQNKMEISWKNINQYYETFDIEDKLLDAVIKNLDALCDDETEVDESLIKSLLIRDWPINSYRKFAKNYEVESFDIDISQLDEDRLTVLVDINYLPFTLEVMADVYSDYPRVMPLFFEKYKPDILNILDEVPQEQIPYDGIMKSEAYNDNEKILILKKCDSTSITTDIAAFIRRYDGKIEKAYVLAAWDILPDDQKYELLVNHLDVFRNEELPELFNQLAPVYHALASRTNHKVTLEKTPYNERLLERLKKKGYLTSVGTEEVPDESKKHLFTSDKKTVLYCRVKEHKTNPVKVN